MHRVPTRLGQGCGHGGDPGDYAVHSVPQRILHGVHHGVSKLHRVPARKIFGEIGHKGHTDLR
jgi:hypothetical protein